MQETLGIKKMHLAIVAAALAVLVAFGMGIGAQAAYAEDAVPYGDSVKVTKSGWEYTLTNKSNTKGMSLTAVKKVSSKAASNLKVPSSYTVSKNGQKYTYNVGTIDSKAFSGAKKGAKTITVPATVQKVNANAFKGCSATKIVFKTKLSKSAKKAGKSGWTYAKKGWLKGSKAKKVYAKNKATKVVKKSYSKKGGVKAYKK